MVYQVGRPAILEGNRFFPETGTPIWKMVRRRTVFAVCEPEPLTVATWRLKSLTMRRCSSRLASSCAPMSVVAISKAPLEIVTQPKILGGKPFFIISHRRGRRKACQCLPRRHEAGKQIYRGTND